MWDAIGGFGSALASMLDTAVSSSDRRAANELNYYATMDTNKTNANINAEQLAWARELYNLEKAENRYLVNQAHNWNSPSGIAASYRAAGLNPAVMMSQGGGGSGGGSTGSPPTGSVPSSIPMQAAHFDPVYNGGLGLGVQNAINTYMMAIRNETDISAIKQRLDNETAETQAKISSMGLHDSETRELIKDLQQKIQFDRDSYAERMISIELANEKVRKENAKIELDMNLSKALAESTISLNKKQQDSLGAQIKVYLQEIAHLKNSDEFTKAEVSQRVISMINQYAQTKQHLDLS